jgi:hypothetical protein
MARPAEVVRSQRLGQGDKTDTEMLQFLEGGQQIRY